jgi:hypothetical protein
MDIDPCQNVAAAASIIEWTQSIRERGDGLRWGVFQLIGGHEGPVRSTLARRGAAGQGGAFSGQGA